MKLTVSLPLMALPTLTTAANLFSPSLQRPRIIGGSTAPPTRYPYTVARTHGGSDFFCGGSLIAPDMVLTAAPCLGGGR